MDASLDLLDKYPEIDSYLSTSNNFPVFMKLMASILFLRQKIGYTVSETESFYTCISRVDSNVFANISKEDLPKVLECFVMLACSYICDSDSIDIDDVSVNDSKKKVCSVITKYLIAN
jgi:hypothetical protein